MTYVIGRSCVDVLDRACVEECPVDCIYEGGRSLYIHPDECVDCGACEPVCPVEAIYYEDDLPEPWRIHAEDNARFFADPLPGRDAPLGSPGGAAKCGPLGVDTVLVTGLPVDPAVPPDGPVPAERVG
ncbi:MAG TPA: ferredoxin [Mycobacteriales bacterium]|nr:ferredoxin [Mycobacteriales bacterium]